MNRFKNSRAILLVAFVAVVTALWTLPMSAQDDPQIPYSDWQPVLDDDSEEQLFFVVRHFEEGANLRVRAGASTQTTSIGVVNENDMYAVLGVAPAGNGCGANWYRFDFDGQRAFVCGASSLVYTGNSIDMLEYALNRRDVPLFDKYRQTFRYEYATSAQRRVGALAVITQQTPAFTQPSSRGSVRATLPTYSVYVVMDISDDPFAGQFDCESYLLLNNIGWVCAENALIQDSTELVDFIGNGYPPITIRVTIEGDSEEGYTMESFLGSTPEEVTEEEPPPDNDNGNLG